MNYIFRQIPQCLFSKTASSSESHSKQKAINQYWPTQRYQLALSHSNSRHDHHNINRSQTHLTISSLWVEWGIVSFYFWRISFLCAVKKWKIVNFFSWSERWEEVFFCYSYFYVLLLWIEGNWTFCWCYYVVWFPAWMSKTVWT